MFDLPLLEVVSRQTRNTLRVQLHRWIAEGKVIALKRGLYTLGEGFSAPKQGAVLANLMVSPSYLTGLWALSWYGLIPEAVYEYTSAVPSYKQQYENSLGRFSYRRLKPDAFLGWQTVDYSSAQIRVASPEKAVMDHIYWTPGDAVRTMNVLRFQPDSVPGFSWEALSQCAEDWGSPKLIRFAQMAPELFSNEWEEI